MIYSTQCGSDAAKDKWQMWSRCQIPTETETETDSCDACAACGAANVAGNFAYTASRKAENSVVLSGTIWLHQRRK